MERDSNGTGVLVVGSTGAFGTKIVELLAGKTACDLVLAGRKADTLAAQARHVSRTGEAPPRTAVLDALSTSANDIRRLGVAIVINASGPFQTQNYTLARAAIAAGCHYIDLADARDFVCGFSRLDGDARAAGVLAVSGASSVPGLSSAVISHYRDRFAELSAIDIAISPGNSFDPGVATVRSVLGGVGRPISMLVDGAWRTVHGWQGLRRGDFGTAGRRWLGFVDVPDLALLPEHIPEIRTVRFRAGLEVSLFHLGLWTASWLVRGGLVRRLSPLAPGLLAIKRRLTRLGSDSGGMIVAISGRGHDGSAKTLTWRLVATNGHGPFVPALAAVALTKRLIAGTESQRGAKPCVAVIALDDILADAKHLDIRTEVKEKPLPR